MTRRLFVITFLIAGAACGGGDKDDSVDGKQDSANAARADAGSASEAPDAASPGPAAPQVKPDLVTNAGMSCRGANGCKGGSPQCITTLLLAGEQIAFPDGYCTAVCGNDVECGSEGRCPVGESLKAFIGGGLISRDALGAIVPSHCYQPCTSNADCRTDNGYRCATIIDAISEAGGVLSFAGIDVRGFLMGPIKDGLYCLPPPPAMSGTMP